MKNTYPLFCYDDADNYKFEKYDCAVRATKIAFDISYSLAHFAWETAGRLSKRGVSNTWFPRAIRMLGEEVYNSRSSIRAPGEVYRPFTEVRLSTPAALKRYKKGTYLFAQPAHVFAVKNGHIYDTKADADYDLTDRIVQIVRIK